MSRHPHLRNALCIAFSVFLWLSGPTTAAAQSGGIAINHERIEIAKLVKLVGEANRRTILHDETLRGVVSLIAKRSVTEDEAWSMLEASLSLLGFSLLPGPEGVWQVAKIATAVGEAPFVAGVSERSESFVTSLIPLRIAEPADVLAVLEPLSGTSVTLVNHEHSRSLIASGPERRIARLIEIADALDRIDERETRYRVLRYREVSEVEERIETLFVQHAATADALEVWTDKRTNSVIYRGTEKGIRSLSALIDRFDQPLEPSGKIQVLKVLNRDAEEMAEIIRSFKADGGNPVRRLPGAQRQLGVLAGNDYSIAVDAATRSLIVQGSPETQRAVRVILETLDQPVQQIAVDLKITELRTPSAFSSAFGMSIPLSAGDGGSGEVIARLVSTPGGAGLAAGLGADTTIFGRVDQDLNVPFVLDDGSGIAVPIANTGVITAGQITAHNEVLIEPSLVVTVGDRHELFVGTNIPLPVSGGDTELTNSAGSGSGPSLTRRTTIERKDVGITIGIEATAGKVGDIVLDLDVEISDLTASLAGDVALVGPTFVEQKFVANARLSDGQAAIVALNHDRRESSAEAGTPFLSEIPFLGWFFRSTSIRKDDVRLIFTAQVHRVESPAELAADTIRKRLAFERRNAQTASLPKVEEGDPPFAVLVTTRSQREDADSILESLLFRGYAAEVHSVIHDGEEFFDVYVTAFASMMDAANVASDLAGEGWLSDLKILRTGS